MGHPKSDGKQTVGSTAGTQNRNLGRDRSLGVPDTQMVWKALGNEERGPSPQSNEELFLPEGLGG